jgi:hypothetical protein
VRLLPLFSNSSSILKISPRPFSFILAASEVSAISTTLLLIVPINPDIVDVGRQVQR